jgi:sulfate transport system permease protein
MAAARRAITEPAAVRGVLILVALSFLGLFLVVPLVAVFAQALEKGWAAYVAALTEPTAIAALKLTLLVALIAVPANVLFGVAAAWAVARFDFPGKSLLVTLIDLPFGVSPVISGMIFIPSSAGRGCSAAGPPCTASRWCSPCPDWCWRRCSSPSPSSPAS